jgi:pimeloyl-ACP methyl ester carboxylesterase
MSANETVEAPIHIQQAGVGPDVLLIAGLSDAAEAWQLQLDGLGDHYRLIAYDNRGAGRAPLPTARPLTVESMADDAVAVLDALGVGTAHVAGFSGGSCIAQELALLYPERVKSLVLMSTWARPDAYLSATMTFLSWLADVAPSERAMLEAFFLWIYTPRAHADGTVSQIIEDALSFEYPQSTEAFKAQLEAFRSYDNLARLTHIDVPTLVLAGEVDIMTPPRYGRTVADAIPGARFEVLPDEAHQPFQERAAEFNARVDAFWREVASRQ